MGRVQFSRWVCLACLACGLAVSQPVRGEKPKPFAWQPISPEELAMKEHPTSPGAPAIILYREMYTDDEDRYETQYYRIKIFNEEGRKRADVEIPYVKGVTEVKDIRARTIRPDGSTVDFTGTVFEKILVKQKKVKVLAKAITLPEVQAGSIIEYAYTIRGRSGGTVWELQDDLVTRRAHFFIRPRQPQIFYGLSEGLYWNSMRAPKTPDQKGDGSYILELENIPAFEEEEFSPPERWLKMRIEFFYLFNLNTLVARLREVDSKKYGALRWNNVGELYWKLHGLWRYDEAEEYVKDRKSLMQEVERIVSPSDTSEAKLRKIYARVQQVRHLGYERQRTEKEEKRENLKDNKQAKDVLKNGYGTGWDINMLFLGLARAAGFEASVVWASGRHRFFFNPELIDASQLDSHLVHVRVEGKDMYLDPATKYAPYGLLPWYETGVQGLKVGPDGGVFVKLPEPLSSQALVERKAALKLNEEGMLEGTVEVVYHGLEALRLRETTWDEDEAGQRKIVEDELKDLLPASAEVTLEEAKPWDDNEAPLRATFRVKIPELATSTGRRLLVPVAPFHSAEKHPFDHPSRKSPVYFGYPYESEEEVTIELPRGYRVETLPQARSDKSAYGEFQLSSSNDGGTLKARRRMQLNGYFFPVHVYAGLREFYTKVRAGDGEQAVLQASAATDSK